MASKLNTFFSGTVGPKGDRPGPDTVLGRLAMYIILVLLFPFAVIVYATWVTLFTYGRLPWWVPGTVGAAALAMSLPFGGVSGPALEFYIRGYANLVGGLTAGKYSGFDSAFSANIGQIILGQIWLGFLSATLWAGLSIAWKWVRRPAWQERFLTPGPWLKKRYKETISDISKGSNSPDSGITLGVAADLRDPRFAGGKPGEDYGKRVVISDAELAGHVFVVGGSGSGKTQTMLAGIRDVIRQGRGVVFIDCKGGPDVPEQIAEWASRYGRDFLHWSIQDTNLPYSGPADAPAYYDPISRGDASRRKDLLVGSQRWDVEYYKEIVSNYLQTLFMVKDLVPPLEGSNTFTDVAELLSPDTLVYRSRYIDASRHPDLANTLSRFKEMDATERSGIRGMYARLQTLTSSTAGQWLRNDPSGERDIDLRRAADEGQVIVFSLDTSNYEATAAQIAGLIVQDLKTLSSELRNNPSDLPLHVYVDEFSSVDTTNLLGLLAKARDAKMPCTLATQALADLARREPTFVDQVLGIVSSFIVHRANAEADARIYAGLSGVTKKTIERMSIEQSSGVLGTVGAATATGTGYAEEREEYAIPVGSFQKLERGNAIFIAKSPLNRYVNTVQIVMENGMIPESQRDPAIPRVVNDHHRSNGYSDRITYPHPYLVASGEASAPGAELAATGNALDLLLDSPAQAQKPAPTSGPQRPKRPGAILPGTPGLPAGAPMPAQPGQITPGRPAGAPMPTVKPQPRQNPEEWNGIP